MWMLVEKLWNFFELPVTTGTFPGGRGDDEGGEEEGGVTEQERLETGNIVRRRPHGFLHG